ncbi:YdiU family protein [Shewanella sp. JM162201]|uniref:Protein nucleotidyltransferase YdiU n=1 Tax=Shewanella jiangmenensis TaxID=2837387 RepID=A0ABS5V1R9_9GAMM|nr:YdiU family protein [Shewanella jiangmenensis]MBT1443569.1 YdiU family protein [Shewanella jiangmenensis]
MALDFSPFRFDNTLVRDLPGFYEPWQGARVPNPQLVCLNLQLADELGMDMRYSADDRLAAFFSGMLNADGSEPVALVYAGHQFGGFSPRLGDGRALLLGEVIDTHGRRRDIHLKGSGRTNFSRGGDGKAVLGPVLREYLMGEAMHALGVPTTRAIAAVSTGEHVYRDGIKPGAVLARVAASHIRVGTFEYFAARQDHEALKALVDYSLARHYPLMHEPSTQEQSTQEPSVLEPSTQEPSTPESKEHTATNPALALLEQVADAQAALVARWMGLGFIHGVMNTDNVTISGETIDYGPCAFMEAYDPHTVFSSIDADGRYAYGNQPGICRWNLARFAEALLPLLAKDESEALALAQGVLDRFAEVYTREWLAVFAPKFGIAAPEEDDLDLFMGFLTELGKLGLDFTQAFRALAFSLETEVQDERHILSLWRASGVNSCADTASLLAWLERWRARLGGEPPEQTRARMLGANPIYIPRNHLLQAALDDAEAGDMAAFEALLALVCRPFDEQPGKTGYAMPAPKDSAPFRTFCGT